MAQYLRECFDAEAAIKGFGNKVNKLDDYIDDLKFAKQKLEEYNKEASMYSAKNTASFVIDNVRPVEDRCIRIVEQLNVAIDNLLNARSLLIHEYWNQRLSDIKGVIEFNKGIMSANKSQYDEHIRFLNNDPNASAHYFAYSEYNSASRRLSDAAQAEADVVNTINSLNKSEGVR